jgi:aerobic-type carbon monoxide dehydrogenase small subunit (CoxS/CutS family)
MSEITELNVNGIRRPVHVEPDRMLLSVLRDDLDLTGTKYGCGEAQCGACIVLVDGQRTPSCITPVSDAAGKPVTTIEGLAQSGKLHPLQEAFLEMGAFQCGYCTPGMIMAGVALLRENSDPDEKTIKSTLDRNLCRCGAYPRIIAAIQRAAESMKAVTPEETRR